MKIIDGIAYASEKVDYLEVTKVQLIEDMMMIVTFNNNEERLFDATTLLRMPAFEPLNDDENFKSCKIVDGVVSWLNGDIDIAPETMYAESYKYDHISVS